MNRDIKFRCWYGNKMHDHYEAMRLLYNEAAGSPLKTAAVFMQYSGLKDMNGKEIYEGDIITNSSLQHDNLPPFVVSWDDERLAFRCSRKVEAGNHELFLFSLPIEEKYWIVGNIYEKDHTTPNTSKSAK